MTGLANLLAEQFYCVCAAAVRAGHRDLASAIVTEIDGSATPWPAVEPHDRALIYAVRAWGRGEECDDLVREARAAYAAWCGADDDAPRATPQATPLERTKAERSQRRGRQLAMDFDGDELDGDELDEVSP